MVMIANAPVRSYTLSPTRTRTRRRLWWRRTPRGQFLGSLTVGQDGRFERYYLDRDLYPVPPRGWRRYILARTSGEVTAERLGVYCVGHGPHGLTWCSCLGSVGHSRGNCVHQDCVRELIRQGEIR